MNNDRRKRIAAILERVAAFDNMRQELFDEIDEIAGEESDYFDNMPESLQSGDKGTRAEEARDSLYEARDFFDNLDLSEVTSPLESAAE